MKLIGAGFGRTGTKSLQTALEQLGYGPCYHMIEVLNREKNPDHLYIWDEAGQGKDINWKSLFQNYQSTVDWPASAFYQELMKAFPDAKVLLSVRDPEAWHKSAMSTIFSGTGIVKDEAEIFQRMVGNIILGKVFHGDYTDKQQAISVFLKHIEQVKQIVPSEKLLVYDVREGWEPLCHFLNVPIPNTLFPRENSTEDFQARFKTTS